MSRRPASAAPFAAATPVRVLLVHCPQWSLVAAQQAHAVSPEAELALVAKGTVVACSAAAEREGVRPGLRLRQAQHRCPEMIVLPHDPELDERAFEPVLRAIEDIVPGVHAVRPGTAAVRAQGPSRFYGGDRAAAHRLLDHLRSRVPHDLRIAVADGLFTAEQSVLTTTPAEPVSLLPPGGSARFLAPLSVTTVADEVGDQRLPNLLRRLGIRALGELAELPAAQVHARFGDAGRRAHHLARGNDLPTLTPREIPVDLSVTTHFEDPTDNADHAVAVAEPDLSRLLDRVADDATVCTAVRIVVQTTHAGTHERLWRHPWHFTLSDVLDRLRWQLDELAGGSDGSAGHLGSPELGGSEHLVASVRVELAAVVPAQHQAEGLWGARPDQHIVHTLTALQHRLGHAGVQGVTIGGGRLLHERQLIRPWGEPEPSEHERRSEQPWPGALHGPAPSHVFGQARSVQVLGDDREPVGVTKRGEVTAPPCWLVTDPGSSRARRIRSWAGPWPVRQRWWRRTPSFDRFQIVDEHARAWILLHDGTRWWAEASYD